MKRIIGTYIFVQFLAGFLFSDQVFGNFQGDEVYGCANINGATATLDQCTNYSNYAAFNTTAIVENSSVEFSGAWSVTPMSADFHNNQLSLEIVGNNFYFGNLTFAFSDLDCSPACEIVDVSLDSVSGSPSSPFIQVKTLEFWADAILIVLQGNVIQTTATVTFNVTTSPIAPSFECAGFDAPMAIYPVKSRKNRVFPLKMELFDGEGYPLTDSDLIAPPVVQVMYLAASGGNAVDVTDDVLSSGHGTDGNQFVFTDEDKWQFNLKSRNYTAPGEYVVTAISGNETEYNIDPACVTSFEIN